MLDIRKNILEKPVRRWRQISGPRGDLLVPDGGEPNETHLCTRKFTRMPGVKLTLISVVCGMSLNFDTWYDLLLESRQHTDFRHVTGLVDGIGVSELWAVDRMASRDDEAAMRARKQFTPAQRAVVAEWHRRELKYLSAT